MPWLPSIERRGGRGPGGVYHSTTTTTIALTDLIPYVANRIVRGAVRLANAVADIACHSLRDKRGYMVVCRGVGSWLRRESHSRT